MEMSCACKGIRTCPVCEAAGKQPKLFVKDTEVRTFDYCDRCMKAWERGSSVHPNHMGPGLAFPGIFIQPNFVSKAEEAAFVDKIDKTAFVESQSGRRKQDFGPKVNFKKRKVRSACFSGLPDFSKPIYERMKKLEVLSDFIPVEQCHLEYTPERGSSIDPHFDDFWLWGERLVTVNLLSDTILYFICDEHPGIEVHVPMARRSLIVVYGEARTKWKHAIHRSDISDRRLAITLRELSSEFSDGGARSEEGQALLDIALTFRGYAVQ
ncbi:ALKB4-like protein [Mya arenaria]|uniref:ALKB4-like protein n=1 Tax=Mya arenaria TaxID=6604 RepID=A0ABY7E375_MYAAR|nr:alpha-ketoglutarate-dependent dioxygenase alkB homolog 4-like [Mya arenaria]WAR02971.1 ALKB4-like protein [Mya arenaria]